MRVKLGIAPIAWSNDDMPELGGTTPIEKCLKEAKSCGYEGIELGGKFPRNNKIIKYLLDYFKLKMPGGWYGSKLRYKSVNEEWELMQDQILLLKSVGANVFIFADVSGSIQSNFKKPLSKRPELKHNEWKEYCKKISEISNRLDDIGLPMSYHEHMGTIIQTEADIDRFLECTGKNTFLLYDTGHILFSKGDYLKILNKYISRVNHIHCKDVRKNILDNALKKDYSFPKSFIKGVFTVPGDGFIDYLKIFKILRKNNYNKWLVVEAEQDPKIAEPYKYAKIGYKSIKKNLIKSGYKI